MTILSVLFDFYPIFFLLSLSLPTILSLRVLKQTLNECEDRKHENALLVTTMHFIYSLTHNTSRLVSRTKENTFLIIFFLLGVFLLFLSPAYLQEENSSKKTEKE